MRLHRNAALSWQGRRLLVRRVVERGSTLTAAAEAAGVSVRCAGKWVARYRREGEARLFDRSSAPKRVANRTAPERVAAIMALRRLRMTAAEIAETLAMPLSTVSAILTRNGLGRLRRLGLEPAARYERSRPGELVHIDVKNHSRLAYAEVLTDEKAVTAIAFLRRARVFFVRYGIQIERILTDNGSPYVSAVHAIACKRLGIRHIRTRPRRPQTNGKAERFIRTLLAGWAYGAIYRSSRERTAALDGWLWHYNHRRRHAALGHQAPVSRTNVLGSYT